MLDRILLTVVNIFCSPRPFLPLLSYSRPDGFSQLTRSTTTVPPLAVCLITGPQADTLISCFLFLCGVIPSHIHGFYLSCTYFHRYADVPTPSTEIVALKTDPRRKKARKGRYPGPPCTFIFDRRVWYGGLSSGEVERRRTALLEKKAERAVNKSGRRSF